MPPCDLPVHPRRILAERRLTQNPTPPSAAEIPCRPPHIPRSAPCTTNRHSTIHCSPHRQGTNLTAGLPECRQNHCNDLWYTGPNPRSRRRNCSSPRHQRRRYTRHRRSIHQSCTHFRHRTPHRRPNGNIHLSMNRMHPRCTDCRHHISAANRGTRHRCRSYQRCTGRLQCMTRPQ